jgi:hypothetical protein
MTLLLRFWPHLLIVAAVGGAVWWFSNSRYHAGYEDASKLWEARLHEAAEQGRSNVEQALREQREDQDRQRQQQRDSEQKARDQHDKAITAAREEARTWHDRYRHAVQMDSTCAAWSQERVPCPL